MKIRRFYLSFILLIVVSSIILMGCNKKHLYDSSTSESTDDISNITSADDSESAAESTTVLDTESNTAVDAESAALSFNIQSYVDMADGLYGMDTSDTPLVSENIGKRYNDESAAPKVNVDFLNTSYEFEYEYSEDCATSDYLLHVYCLPDKATTKIFVNAKNNEIVEYRFLDFENNLITEQEYLTFIQDLINELYDSRYNLSEYEHSVYTAYRRISENALSSTHFLGFKIMEPGTDVDYNGNEYSYDEELNSYDFTFRKPIKNIDVNTNEYIKVFCSKDNIRIQVFDFGYDENTFKQVVPHLGKFDSQVTAYFKDMVMPGYECIDTVVSDQELFIKDGVIYVRAYVSMKVGDKEILNGYVGNLIEVIAKVVSET